jgi:hypothetical protein
MANSLKVFLFVTFSLAFASDTGVSAQCVSVKTMQDLNLTKFATDRWFGVKGSNLPSLVQKICFSVQLTSTTIAVAVGLPKPISVNYSTKDNVISVNQVNPIDSKKVGANVS